MDWKDLSADDIIKRVTVKVNPGSIVLFHNAALNTPKALPAILEKLQSDGYTIVPVSEILLDGETTIDFKGRQHAKKMVQSSSFSLGEAVTSQSSPISSER